MLTEKERQFGGGFRSGINYESELSSILLANFENRNN